MTPNPALEPTSTGMVWARLGQRQQFKGEPPLVDRSGNPA